MEPLPGLNHSLCGIVHKMKVDLNASDKGQCPPCHPEDTAARPEFTAPTKVQCSRRWRLGSALLPSINPCDGPPDRPAGRHAEFLESSRRPGREAPFMPKMALVCGRSGPSSVGYHQATRASAPWDVSAAPCRPAQTAVTGVTLVTHTVCPSARPPWSGGSLSD